MIGGLDYLRELNFISPVLRLTLAMLFGGMIGTEREFKRRSADFRTHILICLGAAMTTMLSEFWAVYMRYCLDMTHLGAGVVAGMGFIGAGAIIVTDRLRALHAAAEQKKAVRARSSRMSARQRAL